MAVGFEIDLQKCTECERCVAACSLVKFNKIRLRQARITIHKNWPDLPHINICRFDECDGQPCIPACPVKAISNKDGIVLIDPKTCTGCGACIDECPYQAIRLDDDGLAYKCDFCGGDPACVRECASEALCRKGS